MRAFRYVSLSLFCLSTLLSAQNLSAFELVIPRGPSVADHRAQLSGCEGADTNRLETFFRFTLSTDITNHGRSVTSVDPTGPAAGELTVGDVILSLNGTPLVDSHRNLQGHYASTIKPIDQTVIDRGIYVYGLRNGAPFQAIVWSCAGAPVPHFYNPPSSRNHTWPGFNRLYPELGPVHPDAMTDMPLIVAAMSAGQGMGYEEFGLRHPIAPKGREYCLRPTLTRLTYDRVRTTVDIDGFGIRHNERTEVAETYLTVDQPFYGLYLEHFDAILNDPNKWISLFAKTVRRTIEEYGCASPEYKDFERRIYDFYDVPW